MLGLFDDFVPKFVKRYADVKQSILGAVQEFVGDVKQRKFPAPEHSFK
jgi:3-methyl-2-oxobutanoate hydroxymethyltransferase